MNRTQNATVGVPKAWRVRWQVAEFHREVKQVWVGLKDVAYGRGQTIY
ncbi:hypothetical protein [Candidatus Cyanaurora vandensis]|nr:hypothetical protein [Candidatus Cyanaurora vandensis]